MRIPGFIFILFTLALLGCKTQKTELLTEQKLNKSWEFKNIHESTWHPATVPGNLLSELFKGRSVIEPWSYVSGQMNEMAASTWEYRTFFNVSPALFSKDSISINFPDLQPNTAVYLNNILLADANQPVFSGSIPCKKYVKIEENCLRLVFNAKNAKNNKIYRFPYRIASDLSNHAKGDSCLDLLNKLDQASLNDINIPGIPEIPYLIAWTKAKIESVHFYPLAINDKEAQYNAEIEIMASVESELNLEIIIDRKPVIKLYELKIKPGINKQIVSFTINNPKLWWLNGLGAQHLYNLSFRLISDRQLMHELSLPLGVRKLEINFNPDSITRPMKIIFNGQQAFLKGCIVEIPENVTPENIDSTYKQIVERARLANLNIVRLLHTNMFKPDLFYNLCNERGILIWQDFRIPHCFKEMTAIKKDCCENKIKSSILQLRNLSSCAVFMGTIAEAEEMGKQNNHGNGCKPDSCNFTPIMLHALVKKYDRQTFYWNVGEHFKNCGQMKTCKPDMSINCLMTSFGSGYTKDASMQSLCSRITFNALFGSSGISTDHIHAMLDSPQYLKALTGLNADLSTHVFQLLKYYKNPKNIDELIYVSNLYQADKIKQGIENYRVDHPGCAGLINIPMNDRAPSLLGAISEISGHAKPGYYALSKAYANIALIVQKNGNQIKIYGINEELKDIDAILLCKIINFSGNVYYVKQVPVKIKGNSNTLLLSIPSGNLLKGLSAQQVCLTVQLSQPGRTAASNIFYFAEPRFLALPEASIKYDINETARGFNIIVRSNVLAKNVVFETNKPNTWFSDNNIDMLPGRRYKIQVIYPGSHQELLKNLKIFSLNNYTQNQQ